MLCQISNFWFQRTEHLMRNHLTGIEVASVLPEGVDPALYEKRSVVARKLRPLPVEAIARGYLIGSGWKDYQKTGHVSGIRLPEIGRASCRGRARRREEHGGRWTEA